MLRIGKRLARKFFPSCPNSIWARPWERDFISQGGAAAVMMDGASGPWMQERPRVPERGRAMKLPGQGRVQMECGHEGKARLFEPRDGQAPARWQSLTRAVCAARI